MTFQKITFAIAAVAALCPASPAVGQHPAPSPTVGQHPTPPVLDSLIKGTLPARGLYVFRFAANTRRMKHLIGIADSTEINALIIEKNCSRRLS